jgi:Putative zinc-finger
MVTRSAVISASCIAEDVIVRLAAGELAESERAILDEHLDQCPSCRTICAMMFSATPAQLGAVVGRADGPRSFQDAVPVKISTLIERQPHVSIYHAVDLELAREVIVYALDSQDRQADFAAELDQAAAMEHGGFAALLRFGTLEDGRASMVFATAEQPLAASASIVMLASMAQTVAFAHAQAVYHGALTESCFLQSADGEPVLFGIGSWWRSQVKPPTAAQDVTAFGNLLERSIAGKRAAGALASVIAASTDSPPGYRSMIELSNDLIALRDGGVVSVHLDDRRSRAKRWIAKHKFASTSAVLGLVSALAIVGYSAWSVGKDTAQAQRVTKDNQSLMEYMKNQLATAVSSQPDLYQSIIDKANEQKSSDK